VEGKGKGEMREKAGMRRINNDVSFVEGVRTGCQV